jgi:hypothetical protein
MSPCYMYINSAKPDMQQIIAPHKFVSWQVTICEHEIVNIQSVDNSTTDRLDSEGNLQFQA